MAYEEHLDAPQSKSLRDLGMEAFWFVLHTVLALVALIAMVGVMTLTKPNPDAVEPKMIATALAFVVPLGFGVLIAKWTKNDIARYVWISGLLFFSSVCVWVLDLPTGAGLCEHCGAVDKLWRTFFDISHGSGLMGGDGLAVGVWIPLSMFGYAVGAGLALGKQGEAE
jgi:hypothetical protein